MAIHRILRLVKAEKISSETRLLELTILEGEIGFVGGQYIIVDTGVPLPGGKVAKRAYSILSSDRDQRNIQIAVRRISLGPGSHFMHEIGVGNEIRFSGPWGKFTPHSTRSLSTLVLATDTGITAALGLVQSIDFESHAVSAGLVWFVESDRYFLPERFVRERLQNHCRRFALVAVPVVGHPERISVVNSFIQQRFEDCRPEAFFLCGDGKILYPLRERLLGEGIDPERIWMEPFFNNPERKVIGG